MVRWRTCNEFLSQRTKIHPPKEQIWRRHIIHNIATNGLFFMFCSPALAHWTHPSPFPVSEIFVHHNDARRHRSTPEKKSFFSESKLFALKSHIQKASVSSMQSTVAVKVSQSGHVKHLCPGSKFARSKAWNSWITAATRSYSSILSFTLSLPPDDLRLTVNSIASNTKHL